MRRTFLSVALAAGACLAFAGPASAGGKALSCYEKAVVPAAYKTVHERVLVKPATRHVVRQPAVYGYRTKRVVVQPERVTYRSVAPIYQTQHRKVLVRPASVGWEYQYRKGRKVLCKVKHPAVYNTVAQTVLVKPGGRVAIRQPAIYGTVKERVLVRAASSHVVQQPAVYNTVTRTVKVRDAQAVWRPVSARCYK